MIPYSSRVPIPRALTQSYSPAHALVAPASSFTSSTAIAVLQGLSVSWGKVRGKKDVQLFTEGVCVGDVPAHYTNFTHVLSAPNPLKAQTVLEP